MNVGDVAVVARLHGIVPKGHSVYDPGTIFFHVRDKTVIATIAQ